MCLLITLAVTGPHAQLSTAVSVTYYWWWCSIENARKVRLRVNLPECAPGKRGGQTWRTLWWGTAGWLPSLRLTNNIRTNWTRLVRFGDKIHDRILYNIEYCSNEISTATCCYKCSTIITYMYMNSIETQRF